MPGLVASLVLRCDDCITYHVIRCAEEGVTDEELFEVFAVGLVVRGGSQDIDVDGHPFGRYLRASRTPIRIRTAPPPCSGTSRSLSTAHATMAATTGVMHMYTAVRLLPTRATLEFQIR